MYIDMFIVSRAIFCVCVCFRKKQMGAERKHRRSCLLRVHSSASALSCAPPRLCVREGHRAHGRQRGVQQQRRLASLRPHHILVWLPRAERPGPWPAHPDVQGEGETSPGCAACHGRHGAKLRAQVHRSRGGHAVRKQTSVAAKRALHLSPAL